MKVKNPLKKLTLFKTTVAHLDDEQMTAARGGSCGQTTGHTEEIPLAMGYTFTCG